MEKMMVEELNLHYGSFHALKNINLPIPEHKITAFIIANLHEIAKLLFCSLFKDVLKNNKMSLLRQRRLNDHHAFP